MRSLCLAILTLCAASAAAQPTLQRDRAPQVPSSIRGFLDQLYSPDAKLRADAACEIGRRRHDAASAMPILLTMLHDDVVVQGIDCDMREWLRNNRALTPDMLKWSETSPAKEAAETLGEIGDAAVPGLLRALGNNDWRIRKFAAFGLGEAEPQLDRVKVVAALADRLTDSHPEVRDRSAWALGEIEDAGAVPALVRALRGDADRRVRLTSAWALGEIEDRSAVNGLVPALKDPDVELRKKVAWALGEIEDASAVAGLVQVLRNDADTTVRREAVWALGEIEDASAVSGLVAALRDPDVEIRKKVAWALGEIEDSSAVPGLVQALGDDADIGVRREAAWALGEIEVLARSTR